jgi:hypothetical protein
MVLVGDGLPFSLVRPLTDILMLTVHKTGNIAANHADPGKITPELHDILTASLRLRGCSAASRLLASSCGQAKVGSAFSPPTMESRRSRLCRRHWFWLLHTSFRHQVSELPNHRRIWASVVGSNEEDKWPLPWVPLTFCVVYLPRSLSLCSHSFASP